MVGSSAALWHHTVGVLDGVRPAQIAAVRQPDGDLPVEGAVGSIGAALLEDVHSPIDTPSRSRDWPSPFRKPDTADWPRVSSAASRDATNHQAESSQEAAGVGPPHPGLGTLGPPLDPKCDVETKERMILIGVPRVQSPNPTVPRVRNCYMSPSRRLRQHTKRLYEETRHVAGYRR